MKKTKQQLKADVAFYDYDVAILRKKQATAALLASTSDEELGRMYRQKKEAIDFLAARGLY